jgi:predicted transcriptional regulator
MTLSFDPRTIERLTAASKELEQARSQIAEEAINEKLDRLETKRVPGQGDPPVYQT